MESSIKPVKSMLSFTGQENQSSHRIKVSSGGHMVNTRCRLGMGVSSLPASPHLTHCLLSPGLDFSTKNHREHEVVDVFSKVDYLQVLSLQHAVRFWQPEKTHSLAVTIGDFPKLLL